jgi:hypothetical protein
MLKNSSCFFESAQGLKAMEKLVVLKGHDFSRAANRT